MNSLDQILHQTIGIFVILPFVAFIATLFWQNKQERPIAMIVQFTKFFYILATVMFAVMWFMNGREPVDEKLVTFYETSKFVFAIHFYYDYITAVFSIVGAILFFLVSTFSRYYMHRDEGYKRFFNTILLFSVGYNIIVFSGNFETLFIGWEIIGLSSFLLIAFYRNRYLPVKNAFKTLSNYRISDMALMLAMWMMHHLAHRNITFTELASVKADAVAMDHSGMVAFIVIMLIVAAMIKSAQMPFTTWLPRAMEGPTSSSAIFYGSLSVHIGVFLLLRTYPFWQDMLWVKVVIITIGALTGIIGSLIARVQPTVKTQIAYSSAAQIGIIFIEVALGFHILALIHFAGNAFLRTYQLLVSPSVLNYLIHHQYFHFTPKSSGLVSRLNATIYMLSIKEWNLDTLLFRFVWSPFKWMGQQIKLLKYTPMAIILAVAGGVMLILSIEITRFDHMEAFLPLIMLAIALISILTAFVHRQSALHAWWLLFIAHLFILTGLGFSRDHPIHLEYIYYASGIIASFILGYVCLLKIKAVDHNISLNQYHGYVYEQKTTGLLFLLAAVGIFGFPITAAFVGLDVLFSYLGKDQYGAIILLTLCFIFMELAAIRIYCRIFLGLHKKLDHPVAFRSS